MAFYGYLGKAKNPKVDDQRTGILEYANVQGFYPVTFVKEVRSNRLNWKKKHLFYLINRKAMEKDRILIFDVCSLSCSISELIEILQVASRRSIIIDIGKGHLVVESIEKAETVKRVLLLSTEMRIKPKKRKARHSKLDNKRKKIIGYLNKGLSKSAIARLLNVSRPTLYDWLKKKKLFKEGNKE